jgi:hypothetical protein
MKRTIKAALGAAPFLIMANVASAGEPVQLSDQQMDGLTAAGSAMAEALADAIGGSLTFTETAALAAVEVVDSESSQATTINLVQSGAQASSLSLAE